MTMTNTTIRGVRHRTPSNILLARFTPNRAMFDGMKAATLKIPYGYALWQFSKWLESYCEKNNIRDDYGQTISPRPPYRLLNSALVACAPTIVHGFEWYKIRTRDGRSYRELRMLVVAKPGSALVYPTVDKISNVMRQWIHVWHDSDKSAWMRQAIEIEGEREWNDLLATMNGAPDTDWHIHYDLNELLTDTGTEAGSAFDLVPSLIATLLHDTKSVIHGKTIRWRRMQEGGKHLCLISQPLPVKVTRNRNQRNEDGTYSRNSVSQDAYLCYKVDVALHNQSDLETPWVYLKPRCTRLAYATMTFNKRDTELTILTGTNESRLTGWPTDTTLVRLKASKRPKDAVWLDDLPKLLERIGARDLQEPKNICSRPLDFWHAQKDGLPQDEYYVLHTEGYKYKGIGKHPVFPGLPLPEQAEIISALAGDVLQEALTPDPAIAPDSFCFLPNAEPVILRNIEEIRKFHGIMTDAECRRAGITKEQARQQRCAYWRPILLNAITRAIRGKRLIIACFYHTRGTLGWIEQALWRNSLLLTDGDPPPGEVTLLSIPFPADEADLIKPCPKDKEGKIKDRSEIMEWREALLKRWQDYIGAVLADSKSVSNTLISAIVELDVSHDSERNNISSRESAHSVIREAFARQNIRVQMTLPIRRGSGYPQYDAGMTGQSLNVVQEVVTRQVGAVFAPPDELYQGIGLDKFGTVVSPYLDVVAFSFRSAYSGVRYCLATRLRADGTMDVMLPGEAHLGRWIPYGDAYTELGAIFADARKKYVRGNELLDIRRKGDAQCPLRLSPAEAAGFVESVLTKYLSKPTIAIIEAENWRQNEQGSGGWWQLTNSVLASKRDVLLFPDGKGSRPHNRTDVAHLLAVIRLRTGDETPSYITDRDNWTLDNSKSMPNYATITGFVDERPGIFHYLSVNGVGETNKKQPQHGGSAKPVQYKIAGSEYAFKHAPLIEMVPFFVMPEFDNEEGLKALCRVPHYLRLHPGWGMGEVNSPYPLHLGDTLIRDQETILGIG